jgi:hypothetical protein
MPVAAVSLAKIPAERFANTIADIPVSFVQYDSEKLIDHLWYEVNISQRHLKLEP